MSVEAERFRVNADEVAAKVIDDEAIIINLTTGVYYSIDTVGARIWSLLENHHDPSEIAAILAREYAVGEDECRGDVVALVEQLREENLILPSDAVPDGEASAGPAPTRQPYAAPAISIFRDMGDLLALDPPVPGLEPIPWDDPARDGSQDPN